jgi:hypothetical protein
MLDSQILNGLSCLQDLNSLGVSVDPFFVNRAGEEFDAEIYWNVSLGRTLDVFVAHKPVCVMANRMF